MVRERGAHVFGTAAYWLMMTAVLALGALVLRRYYLDLEAGPDWRTRAVQLVVTIVSSNWLAVFARTVYQYPWLLVAGLSGLLISLRVHRRLDEHYSEFWHHLRRPLRELLERGRDS